MTAQREVVLVADDDEDIVRFVEINLRLEGFDVHTVQDGDQALRVACELRPDLVLLDVMMPKVDGVEVCQRLRADSRTRNLCVIMLTAKSLSADKVVGLTAGADDYIVKPFDPTELVARVKSALRRAANMRGVNPLTQLPGNVQVHEELVRRVELHAPFALMYVDLDNFKAFNDYYGFMKGDEAIALLSRVISDTLRSDDRDSFVGHIGGDDFVAIVAASSAEAAAARITEGWDRAVPELYEPDDVERGYIEVADRRKEMHRFPLTTVSIGIATNAHRVIRSHWEASEIASEMKSFAKREPKSSYAVDRRSSPD